MSQLRQRANEVKTAGAQRRRNWNPPPESSHYRIYRWWQRKSGAYIKQENFCHYWRVVFIWAPLRVMTIPLMSLVSLVAITGLIFLIVNHANKTFSIVAPFAVIAYIFLGFRVLGQVLASLSAEFNGWRWRWLEPKGVATKTILVFVTLPVVLGGMIVVLVLGSMIVFLVYLEEEYDLYSKIGRWFGKANFGTHKLIGWIRPWLIFPIALIISSGLFGFWHQLLIGVGAIFAFCGIVMLLALLSDLVEQRTKERQAELERTVRERTTLVILHRLFGILHPEQSSNESLFELWLERYKRYCADHYKRGWSDLDYRTHVRYVRSRYFELYGYDVGNVEHKPNTAPTAYSKSKTEKQRFVWLKSTLRATRDLLALAWQVVLVKKWGICPIVKLPR